MKTCKADELVKVYLSEVWKIFLSHNCRKILDVGCGAGCFGLFIKPRQDIVVYGIDINKTQTKWEKVVIGDARNLPFKKESFDGVLANHLIEHIPVSENRKVVKEFNRVLKNRGLLVLSAPLPSKKFWDMYDHVRPYSLQSLSSLVKDAGFEMITAFFYGMGIPGFGKLKLNSLSYKLRKFFADKLHVSRESVLLVCRKGHPERLEKNENTIEGGKVENLR